MSPFEMDLSEHASGIVCCDIHTARRRYGPLVAEHLGTANRSGEPLNEDGSAEATLDPATWSDGSFLYVPPGIDIETPLQVDIAVSGRRSGSNERTLVVVDEGSRAHYIDGCSAPAHTGHSTRSAVVEIIVKPNAHVTFSGVQNWSSAVHTAVTTRVRVGAGGHLCLVDGFFGSSSTETALSVLLDGTGARAEVSSILLATAGQRVHETVEVIHAAPRTTSDVSSKAICANGGAAVMDWSVGVDVGASDATTSVAADALLIDEASTAAVHPRIRSAEPNARIEHDTTRSRISDEQRFYLASRGLSDDDVVALIVGGFIGPITASLPVEYAVEWSRVIELHLDGHLDGLTA